jgi:kynureninase
MGASVLTADFAHTRAMFHLPKGVIYLDGNSLGPMTLAVEKRMRDRLVDEWGQLLIKGWTSAGWMVEPGLIGDRIGRLIGAPQGTVTVGDTLSLKIYQALAATLEMRKSRSVILSDTGNFPSDLYMAQGLIETLGRGHQLRLVEPEAVADAIDDTVAVVMLTQVDYRTGRLHDMRELTKKAQSAGALIIWDLAHSAGAIEVDVAATNADFAAGCTYKYLNGGPGAPAFIYAAPRHHESIRPALAGWLGHAVPFAFERAYHPSQGIDRLRIGTPPVLAMAALNAALDVFDTVSMRDVRAQSIILSNRFIAEVDAQCSELVLASSRDADQRGSQVSFSHPQGYAIMQSLIAQGVVGDFRAPDIIRFGFSPLYLSEDDIIKAATILATTLNQRLWDRPDFHRRAIVT